MSLKDRLEEEISVGHAYLAMVGFVETYLQKHGKESEDIAKMLKTISFRDRFPDKGSIDMANWLDWLDAVKKVTK